MKVNSFFAIRLPRLNIPEWNSNLILRFSKNSGCYKALKSLNLLTGREKHLNTLHIKINSVPFQLWPILAANTMFSCMIKQEYEMFSLIKSSERRMGSLGRHRAAHFALAPLNFDQFKSRPRGHKRKIRSRQTHRRRHRVRIPKRGGINFLSVSLGPRKHAAYHRARASKEEVLSFAHKNIFKQCASSEWIRERRGDANHGWKFLAERTFIE